LHQNQQKTMPPDQFTIFGDNYPRGSYILFLKVSKPIRLSFGKFQGGRLLDVPKGEYLYIGSALGSGKADKPLAQRLVRHASRSGNNKPQPIQKTLRLLFEPEASCKKAGTTLHKKMHWHIDYLLDCPETEITHIVVVQSPLRLEPLLCNFISSLDTVEPLAKRLGAQDTKNSTHLLKIADSEQLLLIIKNKIPELIA
jgi:Uri superfamily endonuclease